MDGAGNVVHEIRVPSLNSDLSAHADVATAARQPLLANSGMCFHGFILIGAGFKLKEDDALRLRRSDASHATIIRPYRGGKDLTDRPKGVYVVDFGLRSEPEARGFPVLYDLLRTRVKPQRDANKRPAYRDLWWRFGEPQRKLREAISGLPRYIATVETMKHRVFTFLEADVAPDYMLICIANSDAFALGVLSSMAHVTWAHAAGGRLGVGNDPRYNNSVCFDPFPFPDANPVQRGAIADVAEELDRHRKEALARDERVTITGMYNVLEKLRFGEALTAKERAVHESAACGVLRDLHDALDRLVADAYGWPWPLSREEILDRLVALHDARAEEEKQGVVRWLRPDYQVPRFGTGRDSAEVPVAVDNAPPPEADGARPWPARVLDQLSALQALLGAAALTPEEAAARFDEAPIALVRQQLELLAEAGEAWRDADGRYHRAEQPV